MKIIINLIVCISTILALPSCNSSQEANSATTGSNGSSQKLENRIAELEHKVDSLTKALEQTKQEITELNSQEHQEHPKNTLGYVSIGIPLVALLSFFLIIAFIWKAKGSKRELPDPTRRNSKLEKELQVIERNFNDSIQEVKNRLSELEQQFKQLTADDDKKATTSQQPTPTCGENPDGPRESESYGVGYAKNDANVYFMKIYDSNQEGCVFKIDFTSSTKGTFDIISLDKIRSRNDWQQKVVCSGISIKDASGYCVEDEGICEKIDNNAWKVTKPLKIKLF